MPRSSLLVPSVPPLCVRIVFTVATTIRIRKATPTNAE
jgi:hypothetical protein